MLGYYLELAIRSLKANLVLTTLMVVAVGVGIGASMTMLTTLVAMSSNPIPDKSSQLFVPQLDTNGWATRNKDMRSLPREFPYRDAVALMAANLGIRRAAMYPLELNVRPSQGDPFHATGRATYSDFFAMFEVPFRSGAEWGRKEDNQRANVVVMSARAADRLFPGGDPVGRTIAFGEQNYTVVGVLRPWAVTPRFYDLGAGNFFGETEDFYLPFSTAIDRQMAPSGDLGCDAVISARPSDWDARLASDCPWIEFWIELPTTAQVREFRNFLQNYAADQHRLGRFRWLPIVALRDVMEWMVINYVVPNEVRVDSLIAIGFLIVCLINAAGLLLAKFASRASELSVRRALGASRTNIFVQCITESMVVGLLGGGLGLALTATGLWIVRTLRGVADTSSATGQLFSLNVEMVLITLIAALVTTICSGLYPAFRASRVEPGWQLKVQ